MCANQGTKCQATPVPGHPASVTWRRRPDTLLRLELEDRPPHHTTGTLYNGIHHLQYASAAYRHGAAYRARERPLPAFLESRQEMGYTGL